MAEGDGVDGDSGGVTSRTAFISYASHDTEIANTVCRELEIHGIRCWIAPRDVAPGALYADAIVRAINEAKVLLIVLSQSAVASSHVGREIERAASKLKQIIALRIDTAPLSPELEYFLSNSQWIDVASLGMPKALVKLTEAVGRGSATSAASNPAGGTVGRPSVGVLKWVVAAVVIVIVVASATTLAVRFWPLKLGSAQAPGSSSISDKSIAVLPFADMSEKKDQEYFSDGMAEEIIDLLVKIPELVVPARTSSFYFKGKSTQIPEIAKQLGVRNILEGSVRKSGNHLRVTAQLVRADNGYHLWSETYNSTVDDVFKTQDEIAGAVVGALKVSLLGKEILSAKVTTSSEAYDLYLQARSLIYRDTSDDSLKAYAILHKAVDLDPNFALAWATLATVLTRDSVAWDRVFPVSAETRRQFDNDDLQGWQSVWEEARVEAHAAADRAIERGPTLADSHAARARILSMLDWNWTEAEAEMKRALELDPGNASINLSAADIIADLGRLPEAIRLAVRAKELDPLGDAHILGWLQYANGELDLANASLQRVIELYPTVERVHFHRACVLLAMGKPADALSELELESHGVFRETGRPLVLDALGRHAEADRAVALAEKKFGNGMAFQIAYFYVARRDFDRTFYWLERAYKQRDGGLSDLKIDPHFRGLKNDPRYKAMLRKVGLPE